MRPKPLMGQIFDHNPNSDLIKLKYYVYFCPICSWLDQAALSEVVYCNLEIRFSLLSIKYEKLSQIGEQTITANAPLIFKLIKGNIVPEL